MLAVNASPSGSAACVDSNHLILSQGFQPNGLFSAKKVLSADIYNISRPHYIVSALRNSNKKAKNLSKKSKTRTLQSNRVPSKDNSELPGESLVQDRSSSDIDLELSSGSLKENVPVASSSRSAVLQACVFTSGCLLALGAVVRQVSHIAFTEGAPVFDATAVSFSFEAWHVEWIIGLVILISSCRYILLKTWPDFSESSEAANQQVLGSLQPLDYIIVAFLPGISEELLFRGAVLPIFGLDWRSALAVGAIFGCLHLGNGRRYSFAIWATFVGFAYGLATINSSSIVAAMASHSLNNLVGGILWRHTTVFERKKNDLK
ncbi:Type II CAAX prenyl endopeptidase Rce1-like protein [Dioscorea alata]|uniref:Type II CAAX prenyl endopeptidase Rce1-like protein n=2 Tax=Dioscorea alata TaxID=55571 RepID=A0ACB7VA98_DIOAL|nr:Type II CAAX prenyl endopeptidase Rce1-like protein [Dioscorea alata]KAH7670699.1 Type II CAAX prenyl endopeptidase Rce1-like protein [Dioscorea alata]